jgi:D-alanyl-D-alanine carboxypeptidase
MTPWLPPALDYIGSWLAFQLHHHDQPGCAIAVTSGGEVVLEAAFGQADLATGEALTPRHGFRVASHSKSFTAAGILKLVEAGRLRLDDPVGRHVKGLHPDAAAATLAQVLSHSAGLVRDGVDAGYFVDRRPNPDRAGIVAELAKPPILPASQRFKYSNYGYALLGLVIEAATGESYADWIAREVVAGVGLAETMPDITLWSGPMAKGHSGKVPLGHRIVVPGDNPGEAMTSAAGFVATAADVASFFAQLAPKAERSILSALSRREMSRRLWSDEESGLGRHYGLGTISGGSGDWTWFGHAGGFQGFITRTCVLPKQDIAISVLTNAIDGLAHPWLDGVMAILQRFAQNGAPTPTTQAWSGRWWTIWRTNDLVPFTDKVLAANPAQFDPFFDASEIAVEGEGLGRIVRASGFGSPGETARLVRNADGAAESVWLGGAHLLAEDALKAEMLGRYGSGEA